MSSALDWLTPEPAPPPDPVADALAAFLELAEKVGLTPVEDPNRPRDLLKWNPQAGPQTEFFYCDADECLYGGAAGGGKSSGEVALPLRWVHRSEFRALILRRETTQLQDLLDKAAALYPAEVPGARWRGDILTWTFPSGAKILFGHCKDPGDWEKYAGHEYHLIEFDELTHFLLVQYREITKRVRSAAVGLPRYVR